jgi:hypothetical protein
MVLPSSRNELVARHRHKQSHELLRTIELKLSGSGADKETPQDRLANVHRIKNTAQPLIAQVQPNFAADQRLVLTDKLQGSLIVPGSNLGH